MSQPDTCIVPSGGHTERRCSYKYGRSLVRTFPLDSLDGSDGREHLNMGGGKLNGQESVLLCRDTYPGHSSLRDVPRGIFAGTLQSRDHKTLLVDRRTSSHSQLHMYPGCILRTEESELNCEQKPLSHSQTAAACKDTYIKLEVTATPFPFSDTLHCSFSFLGPAVHQARGSRPAPLSERLQHMYVWCVSSPSLHVLPL